MIIPETGKRLYIISYCGNVGNGRVELCGEWSTSILAMGDIDEFCRTTEQCDFVEEYAYKLIRDKGILEAKSYLARLKMAWSTCDEKFKHCNYLSRSFLKDHELN